MTIYAFVQDEAVITLYNELPTQYGNISNFNELTDAEVLEYGFYPYSYEMPAYDPISQYLGEVEYVINATTVTGTNNVINLPSEELDANLELLAQTLYGELLNSMYLSDWAMLSDSGLAGGELAAYTTLRASIKASIAAINTYNQSELESLRDALANALPDMNDRPLAFTSNMTELQTVLSGL